MREDQSCDVIDFVAKRAARPLGLDVPTRAPRAEGDEGSEPVDFHDQRAERNVRRVWNEVLAAMAVTAFVSTFAPELLRRTQGRRFHVWCPPIVAAKGRGGIIHIDASLSPIARDTAVAEALGTIARARAEHKAPASPAT